MYRDFRSTRSASSANTSKSSTKKLEVYIRNISKASNTILAIVAGILTNVLLLLVVVVGGAAVVALVVGVGIGEV